MEDRYLKKPSLILYLNVLIFFDDFCSDGSYSIFSALGMVDIFGPALFLRS